MCDLSLFFLGFDWIFLGFVLDYWVMFFNWVALLHGVHWNWLVMDAYVDFG